MRQRPGSRIYCDLGSPLNAGRVLALWGLPEFVTTAGWIDAIDGSLIARKILGGGGTSMREFPIPGFWPDGLMPYNAVASTEHMTIPNFPYPRKAITMMAWIYPNSTTGPRSVCGEWSTSGATSAMLYHFAGRLQVYITTTGSGSVNVDDGGPVTNNTWNHLAMTWDGSTLTAYANGNFKSGGSVTATGSFVAPTPFHIGYISGAFTPCQGYWGDVGVWNRAMSQREIREYINATRFSHEQMTYTLPRVRDLSSIALPAPVDSYAMGIDNTAAVHAFARRRRNIAYFLPNSWQIDQSLTPETITLDKFHVPLSLPPSSARERSPNRYAQIPSGYDTLPRPVFIDPFPGSAPPWHTPLTQPPRPPKSREDRRHEMPTGALGDLPRPEDISVDKWLSETRVGHRRPRSRPGHDDYSTDILHLADKEAVSIDRWDTPQRYVVVPRRVPSVILPEPILDAGLFPPDPILGFSLPWHTPLTQPARAVRTLGRHEFYPDGSFVLSVPGQTVEDPGIKFHTPMQGVAAAFYLRRPPEYPLGRLDIDSGLRPENVMTAALQAMALAAFPLRRRSPWWWPDLVQPNAQLVELPHPEAWQPDTEQVRVLRAVLRHAWAIDQAAILLSDNFAPPLIPRIRRWMLAAGFWRARY